MAFRDRANAAIDRLWAFGHFERFLAGICILTPGLLILSDDGPERVRDSISAYYDINASPAFYVPLTIVAMLFIVNGVLRLVEVDGQQERPHPYNIALGLFLGLLIVFDHEGSMENLHRVSTWLFFGGNILVMMLLSANKSLTIKIVFGSVLAVTGLAWWTVEWFTVFWAEWVSLGVIAWHYVLDSWEASNYKALTVAPRDR